MQMKTILNRIEKQPAFTCDSCKCRDQSQPVDVNIRHISWITAIGTDEIW